MRTQVNITKADKLAYAASALSEPTVFDQGGISIPIDYTGKEGVVIVVKNTSEITGDVTISASRSHWSVEPTPLVLSVPAGGVRVIGELSSTRYSSKGCIDLDFNFAGEVSAYRFARD